MCYTPREVPRSEDTMGQRLVFMGFIGFPWSRFREPHGCWWLCHMDAGGYATFVRPLLGYKLWIVAKQDLMPNHRGWPDSKGEWQAIVLSPKDDL